MLGLLFRNFFRGPLAIVLAVIGICGCIRCLKCRCRDCACIKRILRWIGYDPFDDFELMILVHQATFESKDKFGTVVQVSAGAHTVKTDPNSNSIFQQPLHITVEQGTTDVVVDLLDTRRHVLATLAFDIMGHILSEASLQPEMTYSMKSKNNQVNKPKIKLTMVVGHEGDVEKGLLGNMNSDVDILVRQQLKKAKQEGVAAGEEGLSEMEVLKQACAGPLELFEGLGKTHNVYVAVLGPPISRRWVLGIWNSQKDFEAKKHAIQEVDMLKVETVQGDPTRHHVFVVNCFDENRARKTLTFRRIDRARDVWVEILHLLVSKCRDARKTMRNRGSEKVARKSTMTKAGTDKSRDKSRDRSGSRGRNTVGN